MRHFELLFLKLWLISIKRVTGIAVFLVVILVSFNAKAQVRSIPRAAMVKASQNTLPRVLNIKAFKSTALYAKRVRLYRATFNNPSKSFSMADGTSMNINLLKNPSFASQGNYASTVLTMGHLNGHVVPINAASESNVGWADEMPYRGYSKGGSINFQVTDDDAKQMSQHIFPGAVFTFNNFMNGSYQPPSGTRNPIMLGTDHATSSNFVSVSNPTPGNVQNAVHNMVSHFNGSGNSQTNYKYYESNNMADWTTKVNVGGTANGTNLNTAFNTTDRTHHRFITIDVTRQLYSIFTNPPDNGFYDATNSTEATPNLMVVGSVNYGVRLLVNLELTFTNNASATAFKNKLAFESYTGNFDMNYLQSHASEITSISAYEVGGNHSGTVFINKSSLQSSINSVLSRVNNQNAKPINFELYDMAWDLIGAAARTGNFSYANRMPAVPVLSSATVTITSGNDGKNANTDFYFLVDKASNTNYQNVRDSAFLRFDSPDNDNGHTNTPWPKYISVTYQLQIIGRAPVLADFQDGKSRALTLGFIYGGLDVFHDNINCNISLSLTFIVPGQSNSSQTFTLNWPNLRYSNNISHPPLYFGYQNGTFHTTTQ